MTPATSLCCLLIYVMCDEVTAIENFWGQVYERHDKLNMVMGSGLEPSPSLVFDQLRCSSSLIASSLNMQSAPSKLSSWTALCHWYSPGRLGHNFQAEKIWFTFLSFLIYILNFNSLSLKSPLTLIYFYNFRILTICPYQPKEKHLIWVSVLLANTSTHRHV